MYFTFINFEVYYFSAQSRTITGAFFFKQSGLVLTTLYYFVPETSFVAATLTSFPDCF